MLRVSFHPLYNSERVFSTILFRFFNVFECSEHVDEVVHVPAEPHGLPLGHHQFIVLERFCGHAVEVATPSATAESAPAELRCRREGLDLWGTLKAVAKGLNLVEQRVSEVRRFRSRFAACDGQERRNAERESARSAATGR